jgi:hypothetical protein
MRQCRKCNALEGNGIWVPNTDKEPGATDGICPPCAKEDIVDTITGTVPFNLSGAIPKFEKVTGTNVEVEHGHHNGVYTYHIKIKDKKLLPDKAMKEILDGLFDEEGLDVEHVNEEVAGIPMDTWCVQFPLELGPLNREYYEKDLPFILAAS